MLKFFFYNKRVERSGARGIASHFSPGRRRLKSTVLGWLEAGVRGLIFPGTEYILFPLLQFENGKPDGVGIQGDGMLRIAGE